MDALCLQRRASTLMEVLVSLMIILLVGSMMLDAAARHRATLLQVRRQDDAQQWATRWRTARLTAQAWAQGDSGRFPDDEAVHWSLASCRAAGDSGGAPDASLRLLRIAAPAGEANFVLRLDNPARQGGPP